MPALWVVPEELEADSASPYAYEACKTASYILWAFSGRKYHGTRTVTEKYECPCRSSFNVNPYLNGDGHIYNSVQTGLAPASGCGCSGTVNGQHVRLRLRGAPVRSVQQVKRGDTVLDPSEYKIVNSNLLQLSGTTVDVCGIEITYTYGVNVPVAGRRAARTLASELVKGWSGDDCILPNNITSVDRQGISFTVFDPQDFLQDNKIGVYEVDLFLQAVNPERARKKARIFSPDTPKAYRVTVGNVTEIGPLDWKITPAEPATWTLDLAANDADILLDPDWVPQGQISTWNGATLFEFDSSRFDITDGVLTVSLTAAETADLSGTTAAWDLYALNSTDGFTLMHILSSTVYLTD